MKTRQIYVKPSTPAKSESSFGRFLSVQQISAFFFSRLTNEKDSSSNGKSFPINGDDILSFAITFRADDDWFGRHFQISVRRTLIKKKIMKVVRFLSVKYSIIIFFFFFGPPFNDCVIRRSAEQLQGCSIPEFRVVVISNTCNSPNVILSF